MALFPNCKNCGAPQGGQSAPPYRAAGTYDSSACYRRKSDPDLLVRRGTKRVIEDGNGNQTVTYLDTDGVVYDTDDVFTVKCPDSVDLSHSTLEFLGTALGGGGSGGGAVDPGTETNFLVDPNNNNALVVAITTIDDSVTPPTQTTTFYNLDGTSYTGNTNALQPSASAKDVQFAQLCAELTDGTKAGFLRWYIPGSGGTITSTFDTTLTGAQYTVPTGSTVREGPCVNTLDVNIESQDGPVEVSAPAGGLPVDVQGTVAVTAPTGGLPISAPAGGLPIDIPNPLPVSVPNPLPVSGTVATTAPAGGLPVDVQGTVDVAITGQPVAVTGAVGVTGAVEIANDSGAPIPVTISGGLADPLPVSFPAGASVTATPAAATTQIRRRHKDLDVANETWSATDVQGTLQSVTITVLEGATASMVDAQGDSLTYPPGSWTWGVERDRDAALIAGTITALTGRTIVHWTEETAPV